MKAEPIVESGMIFGGHDESDLFHMEESPIREMLGLRTVEFVLRHRDNEILLVEAKSSSPKPGNLEKFDDFIEEIRDKFIHTLDLYFSIIVNRQTADEMPAGFKTADYSSVKIILLLVINGHQIKWLPPIKDALKARLKRHIKTWLLDVVVLNHEQAFSHGLIQQP